MIDGKTYNEIIINEKPGVDPEIRELLELINNVDGIETTESCFGHNIRPCRIWCRARDVEALNKFIYNYFYGDTLWIFNIVLTDITIDNKEWDKLEFVLESRYSDFPTVNLMINSLCYRMKEKQLVASLLDDSYRSEIIG